MTTTAHERLAGALARVLDSGGRPPCCDGSGRWVSEETDVRAEATAECADCPLLGPCAAAADESDERHHVWAGRDRTRKQRASRPARRAS